MRLILFCLLALFGCSSPDNDRYVVSSDTPNLKPMVILHDGPGLTYSYIYEYLLPLKNKRELIFYNQISCFKRNCNLKPVEISDLTKQLEEVVAKFNGNYTILADGWADILLMEFLTTTPKEIHPNELILVNPIPLSWVQAYEILSKNSQSFSEEDKAVLELIEKPSQCIDALNIALKNLLKYPQKDKKLYFEKYDCMLAKYLGNTNSNYDYSFFEYLLPKKTTIIYGKESIFNKGFFSNKKVIEITQSSNYPYYENNDLFIEETLKILD